MTGIEEDDIRAAEFALGLLDPVEARAADARAARDPDFARAVDIWRERAIALLGARDEPPPVHVWRAILRGLPANDPASSAMRAVRRWKLATAAASLAALALGALALRDQPAPTRPRIVQAAAPASAPLVAVLRGEDAGVVAVSYDRASRRLTVVPNALALGGKAAELWVIPAGGTPGSLGVIDPATTATRAAPAAERIVPGATLAISAEPAGGSPTGQPTGPVILSGTIAAG